jgi:hypothetical protein
MAAAIDVDRVARDETRIVAGQKHGHRADLLLTVADVRNRVSNLDTVRTLGIETLELSPCWIIRRYEGGSILLTCLKKRLN